MANKYPPIWTSAYRESDGKQIVFSSQEEKEAYGYEKSIIAAEALGAKPIKENTEDKRAV